MFKSPGEDIVFQLTRDEILACAYELGIAKEQITDGVIEMLKKKISLEFANWPEVVNCALKDIFSCPLGLTCYPSCSWWQDSKCTFPGEERQESRKKEKPDDKK